MQNDTRQIASIVTPCLYAVDAHMDVSPQRSMVAHADQAFGILLEIWATPRR